MQGTEGAVLSLGQHGGQEEGAFCAITGAAQCLEERLFANLKRIRETSRHGHVSGPAPKPEAFPWFHCQRIPQLCQRHRGCLLM